MFSKKGNLIINKQNITEEELLELLEPFEIEDLNLEEDNYEITLSSESFLKISSVLENKNIEFDGEVHLVSENLVSVSQQESEKIINKNNLTLFCNVLS